MPTKFGNFMIGTVCYGLVGLFGCIAMSVYARNNTVDRTQKATNQW